MYENNHWIDKPRFAWQMLDVQKLFIFCMLDRAMPYESVCEIFDVLEQRGLTSFANLKERSVEYLADTLKQAGHRFYNQTARFIKENVDEYYPDFILTLWVFDRDELAKNIKGFGYKLASMFHNRLHGTQYAIIDIHINRFLESQEFYSNSYLEKEKKLQEIAESRGMTMEQLDWEIWNKNRIGNRR